MARERRLTESGSASPVVRAWLEQHTGRAPQALRQRVLEHALAAAGCDIADALATAGHRALRQVLSRPGDRSDALDLLAADALVTLALVAQAEHAPADLGRFAAGILQAHRP
jgi:hypothetical protein